MSLAGCCPLQVFGPFTFYDVPGKESIPENASSYVNLVEVEMVLNVYTLLVTRCGLSWREAWSTWPHLKASALVMPHSQHGKG